MNQRPLSSASHMRAARKWYEKGDYNKALQALESLANEPEALSLRANVFLMLGRKEDALACHQAMVKAKPTDPAALVGLASFLMTQGRYDAAVKAYKRAIRLKPDAAALQRDRALALRLAGHADSAIEAYDAALDLDATDGETWAAKADLLIELNRFGDAVECLQRASAARSGSLDASGWISRGLNLVGKGASAEAVLCFDHALALEPNNTLALRGKARALRHQQNLDGALACYELLIELHPTDATVWAARGDLLAELRQFDQALICFQGAVKYDRTDKHSWANSGYCRAELLRPGEALADFERAIELDQDFAAAWEGKGRCLYLLGRSDEAVNAWRRALSIDPDRIWSNLSIGSVLFERDKDYENALTFVERALHVEPEQPYALLLKAQVLLGLKRSSEAMLLIDSALHQGVAQKDTKILTEAALVFSDDLHDAKQALALFDKVIEFGESGPVVGVNRAEMMIRLEQYALGRQSASALTEGDANSLLKSVAAFLVYASYALEGDLVAADRCFADFVLRLAESERDPNAFASGKWRFNGLLEVIVASKASLATKFALAAAIDLQGGQLSSPALAQLRGILPLIKSPAPLLCAATLTTR